MSTQQITGDYHFDYPYIYRSCLKKRYSISQKRDKDKTAKGRFELYAIVGQFQGSGFALGYLILDIHQDNELTRTTVLTHIFEILG